MIQDSHQVRQECSRPRARRGPCTALRRSATRPVIGANFVPHQFVARKLACTLRSLRRRKQTTARSRARWQQSHETGELCASAADSCSAVSAGNGSGIWKFSSTGTFGSRYSSAMPCRATSPPDTPRHRWREEGPAELPVDVATCRQLPRVPLKKRNSSLRSSTEWFSSARAPSRLNAPGGRGIAQQVATRTALIRSRNRPAGC